jgi:predicted transcriptional regulator
MKPVAQQVCQEQDMPISFIDVEQDGSMKTQYNITSVPTIIVLDSSNNVALRHTGAVPRPQFQRMIQSVK